MACCSPPAVDLELIVDDELKELSQRLRTKHGYDLIPRVACPSCDFTGKNQLSTLYVAEYENGIELTFLFLDEDRPNMCTDRFYDCIRRPLFGRHSDIETVFIIDNDDEKDGDNKKACCVEFPGTYSAEQTWETGMPQHNEATIELSKFGLVEAQQDETTTTQPTIWVNTWNHLLGEKNNNADLDITYMYPKPSAATTTSGGTASDKDNKNNKKYYEVRKGSRNEVDARFKGLMTSVSKVMTEERQIKLGKRL